VTCSIVENSYIRETSLPVLRVCQPNHQGEFRSPHMIELNAARVEEIRFKLLSASTLSDITFPPPPPPPSTPEDEKTSVEIPKPAAEELVAALSEEAAASPPGVDLVEEHPPIPPPKTTGVLVICSEKYVRI